MSTPADEMTVALQRAGALCELGRFTEAAGLLRQTIASGSQNPDAWSLLAAAELGAGNADDALEAAEKAISMAPESEWPHRVASAALGRSGRREESVGHAREAVRIDPSSWRALTRLARSLTYKSSDLPEAHELAAQAVALAPNSAETHLTAGVVATASKNRPEAEAAFRQALALDPQNSAAHNELARMRMRGRTLSDPARLADAATGFATSVGVDPRAAQARRNLELVLRVFLARAAYFLFLDAYLVGRIGSDATRMTTRLLPVALLALPAGYAWRFVGRLNADLRRYLLRLLTHERKISLAVCLDAMAVICLLAAAGVPQSSRAGLAAAAAAISALVGRVILWAQVEHSSRAARGLPA